MKTVDAANGKWHGILVHFGVDQKHLTGKHTACPLCGEGTDRFRFDDKRGAGTWICSQCGAGDGIKLVMRFTGLDFKTAAEQIDKIVGNLEARKPDKPAEDPAIRLRAIARGLESMDSVNPVRLYLRNRGLTPSKGVKYHPALRYFGNDKTSIVCPAMVCLIESSEGVALSYHITALTRDGRKAQIDPPRKIMPAVAPLVGGAIRLTKIHEHIGIAEGVETALAVMRDFDIPCWSAANAPLLEKFIPPEGVKKVSVFGDNDRNFAGQKAAYALANRLSGKVGVEVFFPDLPGSDFADIAEAS